MVVVLRESTKREWAAKGASMLDRAGRLSARTGCGSGDDDDDDDDDGDSQIRSSTIASQGRSEASLMTVAAMLLRNSTAITKCALSAYCLPLRPTSPFPLSVAAALACQEINMNNNIKSQACRQGCRLPLSCSLFLFPCAASIMCSPGFGAAQTAAGEQRVPSRSGRWNVQG